MNLDNLPQFPPFVFYIIFLWSIIWKGLALWRCAKQDQKNWFMALLILNTLGILEIAYLFYFAKKRMTIEELNITKYFQQTPEKTKKGK